MCSIYHLCWAHIVKNVVYDTKDPLEFLMLSPLFHNDGDSCSVILLLFITITMLELMQKQFT